MLVHICCSVDSHYFLQRLKSDYPNENIIGYFYDPNIHPYSEFLLRYKDVKRSCKKLGVRLICGEYDYEAWLSGTKGMENEPEKGKRCEYCFDFRVGKSVEVAGNLGCKRVTTTLLMSPKKEFSQLENSLINAVKGTDLEPVAVDYRKNGGTNEQFRLAREDNLYHQDYCGCIFGLVKQRGDELGIEELCEPLGGQIQPGSIKWRLKLYKKVRKYEKNGIKFDLFRQKILNYRLKKAMVNIDKNVVASYFLFYSHFKRQEVKFTLNLEKNKGMIFIPKDDILLISLDKFNDLCTTSYETVKQIMFNPPKLKYELRLRKRIFGDFNLSPIIVLDKIQSAKYEIKAMTQIYPQSIEKIVLT